jgi:hypothetical protein
LKFALRRRLSSDTNLNGMRRAIWFLVTALVAGGCVSQPAARKPHRAERHQPVRIERTSTQTGSGVSERRVTCPARTSDTTVSIQEVGRGAALVFTTSGQVVTLRERVANLIVPAAIRSAPPRLDNVHGGVRLVFETEATADVDVLRRGVREHAGHIAQTCGLVFVRSADANAHDARAEESPPPTLRGPHKTHVKPHKSGEQKSREESKAGKSSSDKRQKDAPKAKPKPKPKEQDKRKDSDKPRTDDKPKEDPKPPLPRLPGVHPEPLPK